MEEPGCARLLREAFGHMERPAEALTYEVKPCSSHICNGENELYASLSPMNIASRERPGSPKIPLAASETWPNSFWLFFGWTTLDTAQRRPSVAAATKTAVASTLKALRSFTALMHAPKTARTSGRPACSQGRRLRTSRFPRTEESRGSISGARFAQSPTPTNCSPAPSLRLLREPAS